MSFAYTPRRRSTRTHFRDTTNTNTMNTDSITFTPDILEWAINNKMNVLINGKHGVGKTLISEAVIQKMGKIYTYFSCPTLDPYTDLMGVPVKEQNDDGETVLRFIRPEHVNFNKVQVMVLDEINRAHPRFVGALMEAIQKKSINGNPIPNLEMVIAMTNPDTEDYTVDTLDLAVKDRFHLQLEAQPALDKEYFTKLLDDSSVKFQRLDNLYQQYLRGKSGTYVSPRRIEYAINTVKKGGKAAWVLPPNCHPGKFEDIFSDKEMKSDKYENTIKEFINLAKNNGDQNKIDEIIKNMSADIDFQEFAIDQIVQARGEFALSLMTAESVSKLFTWDRLDKEGSKRRNNERMMHLVRCEMNNKVLPVEDLTHTIMSTKNRSAASAISAVYRMLHKKYASYITTEELNFVQKLANHVFQPERNVNFTDTEKQRAIDMGILKPDYV